MLINIQKSPSFLRQDINKLPSIIYSFLGINVKPVLSLSFIFFKISTQNPNVLLTYDDILSSLNLVVQNGVLKQIQVKPTPGQVQNQHTTFGKSEEKMKKPLY